ncbi:MAG: L,D-transpeptidase family protein [Hyphomicrobiales bacterium]|nr:L,D-transpeptidase family protein [Hyphomicrobiales bacterium]
MRLSKVSRATLAGMMAGAIGFAAWHTDAQAQVAPAAPAGEAAIENAKPDPLTPAAQDPGALVAPGAAAAAPAVALDADAVRALTEIRAVAAAIVPGGTRGERDDVAALAAFYSGSAGRPLWIEVGGVRDRAIEAMTTLERAGDWGLDVSALRLPPRPAAGAQSSELAAFEVRLSLAVLTYARHVRGGRTDPSTISRLIDMKPRLFDPSTVIAAAARRNDVAAWLGELHPRHAEYHRLGAALTALRRDEPSASEKIRRVEVNLERWRWMPDDAGAFHVWNNVPEQLTRVMRDGKSVLEEKIVVGKPNTPTPMFSADMRFVIFHPSWGVPDGIKANELGPQLRRASQSGGLFGWGSGEGVAAVLRRHDLQVSYGGRPIDPGSVDWSSVDIRRFHFTQPPSGRNVLGVVKFRFPNRFDVYMHDTPERHLFANGTRAFSHGCMRVQNPVRLAEVILQHDKSMSADQVRSFVSRGGQSEVTLSTPVPVHNTYFTARVDEAGVLHLHPDIYGMDARVASALAGRPVQVAAAVSGPARGENRARRPVRTASSEMTSAKPFNPFADLSGP